MSFMDAVKTIWGALADVLVVEPLSAALWLLVVLVLAGTIVFAWRRLLGE